MKPVILITGFASPAEGASDPSGALLPLVASRAHERADVRTLLLPPDPEKALVKAIEALDRLLPDAVLSLGRAESDSTISIERVAVNQGRAEPERGVIDPIDAAGPAAYFSTLPVHAILERMQSGSVSAALSDGAEGCLSNRLFYALLHYVALRGQETWFKRPAPAGLVSRIGLIRVPSPARLEGGSRVKPRPSELKASLKGVFLAIDAVVDFLATPEAKPIELSPAGE